jgi:hypothetical protein
VAGALSHQSTQDILDSRAEREDCLHICRRARAERPCDFDCGAGFTALGESDGKRATFIRDGLPCGAFCAVERAACRTFPSLLPQLGISDSDAGYQLD